MKKLLLLITLIGVVSTVSAQSIYRSGVEAGMNASCIGDNRKPNLAGFEVSYRGEINFSSKPSTFFASFNLGLTMNSYREKLYVAQMGIPDVSNYDHVFYIDIPGTYGGRVYCWSLYLPVNIGYRYAFNDNFSLSLSVGPYIKEGLWANGRGMTVRTNEGEYTARNISNVYSDKMLTRFDFGFLGEISAMVCNHYRVAFKYHLGLTDAEPLKSVTLLYGPRTSVAFTVGYMW